MNPRSGGQIVGELLHEVRPSPRINCDAGIGLFLQEYLRIPGDSRGKIRRQGKCLIKGVRVQTLCMPLSRSHRLYTRPHHIIHHVLRRQAPATRLAVRTQ